MDCCSDDKETKEESMLDHNENMTGDMSEGSPMQKESCGGCCGGTGRMKILAVMILVFIIAWYFTK